MHSAWTYLVRDGTSVLVASVDVDVMVIIKIIIITIVADGHETRNITMTAFVAAQTKPTNAFKSSTKMPVSYSADKQD